MSVTLPILILAIPLFMFLLLGIGGVKMSRKLAGILGITALGAVAVISYYVAFTYFFSGDPLFIVDGVRQQCQMFDVTWLAFTDRMVVNIGFLLDPISAMMLVVITTISFMVHLYSWGYMEHEPGFQRYYAFLALFTFSMLGLVVATNIFQMYIFWELVGVSSYLLIGFFYKLPSAVSASKKAFIVTRFADLFMLIGILVLSYYVSNAPADGPLGTASAFNFQMLNNNAGVIANTVVGATFMSGSVLTWAMVLIFVGGMGKSAMLPLHIWLPDAMEGPTPVSALIHAATMVVAGVYLVARFFPLYCIVPDSLTFIAIVGAITAFYAAVVACTQIDIKRVLAFSTISQIAFMMVSLGVAYNQPIEGVHYSGLGYMASMFHLFTHAMFKACLFLGAGCIIHAVHSNEMSTMGGLRKYMPVTHITFLISCLAIAGIPFFSGFSSKDEIITACFAYSPVVGWIMTGVAAMTAFYMFRLYYGIFWGTENKELHAHHTPHEAPLNMTLPLIVLCVITVGVGVYTTIAGFAGWGGSFGSFVTASGAEYNIHFDLQVAATSTIIAIISIALATYIYKGEKQPIADKLYRTFPKLHRAAYKRFYMDEVYMFVTHKIIFRCVSTPIAWFDRHVIDGTFDFLAWGANEAGETIRPWQSGDVRKYAVWFITGTVALTLVLLCI